MQVDTADVRTRQAREPCIVDHDIKCTELVNREINCSGDIIFRCHITVEIVNIGVACKGIKNLLCKIVLDINKTHFSAMIVE